MKKIFELKVGDKFELRKDLENARMYGIITYSKDVLQRGCISKIDEDDDTVKSANGYWYSLEMIDRVNDKKVEFIEGFEYIIKEDEEMKVDPMSLVQSGDFVVLKEKDSGIDDIFVAIQRPEELILTNYSRGCKLNSWISLENIKGFYEIKKIIRFKNNFYNLGEALRGNPMKHFSEIIYDSENEVKEMTVEDVEKLVGCKVKIVKGE